MIRGRSFRGRLALRFASTVFLLVTAVSIVAYLVLRFTLYQELDLTIRRLASIEAAATSDSSDDRVHFHDQVFLSGDPGSEALLTRYAQFWSLDGEPVLRTGNLRGRDLPLPTAIRQRVAERVVAEKFRFEWNGQQYRSLLYPMGLPGPEPQVYLLQIAASTNGVERVFSRTLRLLALLIGVGTMAAAWLGWWLAGQAVRPVVEIAEEAEAMRAGIPLHRLSAATETREFQRLVRVLNSMLSRIDDLLEGQRHFLADAGHGIRTPLTILRGDLEVALRKNRKAHEYRQTLAQALSDLKTVSNLAEDLIALARSAEAKATPGDGEVVDLGALILSVRSKFAGLASSRGVRIVVEAEPGITVQGNPSLLERALNNLLDNALKYGVPTGGVITIGLRRPDATKVEVSVSDSGHEIPSEELTRVFDRFYRGTAHRYTVSGTGLGLAIVESVAEGLGGRATVESSETGTMFRIIVPC
ncbi:MAG: ATP-binding protein [Gemmatimonadota bacterium]|nr:MAG: ATP-binding protein [Gemmatimonadota bacterium]